MTKRREFVEPPSERVRGWVVVLPGNARGVPFVAYWPEDGRSIHVAKVLGRAVFRTRQTARRVQKDLRDHDLHGTVRRATVTLEVK